MQNNCYDILGVGRNASPLEIKAAFRQLAKQWHPDIHPNVPRQNEHFTEIHQAYKILSNPEERARHDATLRPQPQKPRPTRKPSPTARTGPAPRKREPPKPKTCPGSQTRAQASPPLQAIFATKFALYINRLRELLQSGARIPRKPRPRPPKGSPVRKDKARQPSFDRVFQTVWTQGVNDFVLCSDGVIRRFGRTAKQPDGKKQAGTSSTHNHAWRAGAGILVFLLTKWWHQLNR